VWYNRELTGHCKFTESLKINSEEQTPSTVNLGHPLNIFNVLHQSFWNCGPRTTSGPLRLNISQKKQKNKLDVNYVSQTVVENLKQFAFKGDNSRAVRRTFWLIKVVSTWKKAWGTLCYMISVYALGRKTHCYSTVFISVSIIILFSFVLLLSLSSSSVSPLLLQSVFLFFYFYYGASGHSLPDFLPPS
jgi:hypothetical protein